MVRAITITFILLHMLAPVLPPSQAWGVSFFAYPGPVPGFVFGVLCLLLALPRVTAGCLRALEPALQRIASFSRRNKILLRVVLAAASAPLFWLFRIRHLNWGDAKIFVEAIPHPDFRLTYNWQAPLDVFIHSRAWEFANKLWGWDVPTVYGVISVLSGVIFLQLLVSLAREIGRDRSEKLFIWAFIATGGYMQLFFGYIESYTIIPTGIIAYLWAGICFLRGRLSLFWPILILSLTNAFHPSTITLWPSVLALIRGRPWRYWLKFAAIPLTVASAVVALMESGKHGIDALLGVDFPGGADRRWFVPLFRTETEWEHYTMFSWGHLLDIVNEQLLVAPFGLLIVALLWREAIRKAQKEEKELMLFLALAAAFYLLFTWTWNPDYGGRKDWDLFACAGIPLNVLASFVATRAWERDRLRENGFILAVASLLHTAFWVYYNAHPHPAPP